MSPIIVTGCAGFIGFHLSKKLLEQGHHVLGIDCVNDYYDVSIKEDRLAILGKDSRFSFRRLFLEDMEGMNKAFAEFKPDFVVNLAAQAGVRYSITNPQAYVNSNLVGFGNILECCRHYDVKHLIYASSSSVYGGNTKVPFSTKDSVDHPLSMYAATKKANELMAHTYANLYKLPCTGLRFFTVYGPWGRPDMALFIFTKSIFENKPIEIFNHGNMSRDFTYVDDIVEAINKIIPMPAKPSSSWKSESPDPSTSFAPYKVYNIGNNNPVQLLDMVDMLEREIGKEAIKVMKPMQMGDVPSTYADISDLSRDIGFSPSTKLEFGIKKFVSWYKDYYKI
jgi:UDP-glucuronate 4-epimerase